MQENIYEKKFNEIQQEGYYINEEILSKVLLILQVSLNTYLEFPEEYSNSDKLFWLLRSPLRPHVIKIIEEFNYSYHAELQFIIANTCLRNNIEYLEGMPSLINYSKKENYIKLDTLYGSVKVYKALDIFPYISRLINYGECHNCCMSFIKSNKSLSASTCLIDRTFYGKHYHSFINVGNNILDLSHNAFMSVNDYIKIFSPIIINTVSGYELDYEEQRINNKKSLGEDKNLLLRLALDKQLI